MKIHSFRFPAESLQAQSFLPLESCGHMNGDNTCFLFSRFFHHSCNYRSKNGYRLIDTARYYDNEEAVGKGIKRAIEPGCRNNWHIHHAKKGGGQVLIATAGSGWYQIEGQAPVSLNPGDAVVIPANVKHWHGAKKNSWFSHIAFEAPGEGTSNEWLEPVTGEAYAAIHETNVAEKIDTSKNDDGTKADKSITVNIRYTGKNGAARKFAEEMVASGTVAKIRAEKGNSRYEYHLSVDDPEMVLLIDAWENQEAIDAHHATPMMKTIAEFRDKYDLKMTVERYTPDNTMPKSDEKFIRK